MKDASIATSADDVAVGLLLELQFYVVNPEKQTDAHSDTHGTLI